MTTVYGDFNADGFDDMAIGVPGHDTSVGDVEVRDVGAVNVIYGTADGLSTLRNQLFTQDSPDVLGRAETGDAFGASLAVGDFDGDGYDDLAVGIPGEDIRGQNSAGAVSVFYGSSVGLHAFRNQLLHQELRSVRGVAQPFDAFGASLAAGDFDGDGRDDLAIGTPREAIGTVWGAGAVNVLYGRSSLDGLTSEDNQIWYQGKDGILGDPEEGDYFGARLGVGDFNGDGSDDLVVGVPFEDLEGSRNAGAVNVIYGRIGQAGLSELDNQLWHQGSPGIIGLPEVYDRFSGF